MNSTEEERVKATSRDLSMREAYIVVSSDTHAAPRDLDAFVSYVDPKHREAIQAAGKMGEESDEGAMTFGGSDPGQVHDDDPVRLYAKRKLATFGVDIVRTEGWLQHFNVDEVIPDDGDGRRLAVLEEQGIHAEVTYPGPHLAGALSPLMFAGMETGEDLELTWAAISAYNRWLADFCNAAPGRRAGCIVIDLHDMDRAIEEIEWARRAGLFGGIILPGMSLTNGLPGYSADYYEPFWSACEDNNMVINLHPGFSGMPTDADLFDEKRGGFITLYEVFLCARRPIWFMILGGVFDRHPRLRVVVSESTVHWVPALIRDLDMHFDKHGYAPVRAYLQRRPREYFDEHIRFGGSLMHPDEVAMRHDIGVDKVMWGTDYPHLESAFPFHRTVVRHLLGGAPEGDLRRILGHNALEVWDFDREQLQQVADRCGPSVEDLSRPVEINELPDCFSWSMPGKAPLLAGSRTRSDCS